MSTVSCHLSCRCCYGAQQRQENPIRIRRVVWGPTVSPASQSNSNNQRQQEERNWSEMCPVSQCARNSVLGGVFGCRLEFLLAPWSSSSSFYNTNGNNGNNKTTTGTPPPPRPLDKWRNVAIFTLYLSLIKGPSSLLHSQSTGLGILQALVSSNKCRIVPWSYLPPHPQPHSIINIIHLSSFSAP